MEFMAVLLLLLSFKGLLLISSGVEIYLKPTLDTKCPEPCHTLSHYISSHLPYVPNLTVNFLPGVFTVKANALLLFEYTDGTALIGSEQYTVANLTSEGHQYRIPASEIECIGTTGIAFCGGNNLVIKHLRMRNCYIALRFMNTTNVHLFHVLIENSSGIGIQGKQMLGNTSIVGSAFVQNTRNARFDYLKIGNETENFICPVPQSPSIVTSRLDIERSYFLQGNQDVQYADAGGLTILMQEFHVGVFVRVADTIFFQNRGRDGGNMAVNVQGRAKLNQKNAVVVENCSFVKGSALGGGGIALVANEQLCDNAAPLQPGTFLQVSSSRFLLNHATVNITNRAGPYGSGGAVLILLYSCKPTKVTIHNCSFLQNTADITGAGMEIYERTHSTVVNMITINHTVFVGGSAGNTGGGITYSSEMQTEDSSSSHHSPTNFRLFETNFSENTAVEQGGALVMDFQGASSSSNQILRTIEIMNCDITNNTALGNTSAASSVLIVNRYSSFSHKVLIANVSIHDHRDVWITTRIAATSVIAVLNMNAVWFINCSFYNNTLTALMALASRLTFHGNNTFLNNRGGQGGALVLYESSMYLDNNTLLVFKDNKAVLKGGGILVTNKVSSLIPYSCFFQIITATTYSSLSQFNIRIIMENNTAPYGSALYGGLVDFCSLTSILVDDNNSVQYQGRKIFDTIFQIKPSKANDPSVISSVALDVCFCENDLAQCNARTRKVTIYPGGILNTSVVTVGQRNGTTAGGISTCGPSYGSHPVYTTESSMFYTQCRHLVNQIFTQEKAVNVPFTVDRPTPQTPGILLLVSLLDCPPGFILTPNGSCDCVPVLKHYRITCTIDDQTVHRIAPLWIGYQPPAELDAHSNTTAQDYSNSSKVGGTMVHKHCPFNYCKAENVRIWLNDTDKQCAHHRSGVLCGGCKPGHSVVFGSSRCLTCTSSYLALVLVFAGAGVALVALLMLCDVTVSKGTLNGLVFYANVVQANSSIFFPNTRNQILSIFIAWFNLDLGIETCFYDGMDMYAKAWLQFVFPLYIWFLVIAIIVSSNYSITAAKLAGRNAPKVLSTLFLLSDARILRAVITAFSFTILSLPDKEQLVVWLYDGNINYLSGKHIPLFAVGLMFTVLFLIPYTLVVCFIQHLQRHSGSWPLRWVQRTKPLLDTYTGPYKDKYRFWTGLLLLVRVVLFLATAVNTLGDPSLNLLLIIVTANCLLALELIFQGIHKEWPLDILEASSLLNLSILSAATLYIRSAGGNQVAITSTSTGIALATFVGILIHHTYNSITTSTYWRRLVAHLKRHLKTQNTISRELEPLATEAGSSSSDSDSEGVRMEPHARIQPLRLTFDTNNEPILVAATGDHARVQRQTIDQDEECILVVEDNAGG